MQERNFGSSPVKVIMGLVDGPGLKGVLEKFNPRDETIRFWAISPTTGNVASRAMEIPAYDVAYIGFERGAVPDPRFKTRELKGFHVRTLDLSEFDILIDTQGLESALGFYAYPVSRNEPWGEYYFFLHGLLITESTEPLGEMIVKEGILTREELEKALLTQKSIQQMKIGEILVEQKAVTPEAVDGAREGQKKKGTSLRLGEILVEEGLATTEDIEKALTEQRKHKGKRLGEVLVDLELVDETQISKILAKKFRFPFVDLESVEINPEAISEVPAVLLERYRIFPFHSDDKTLSIAIADPTAIEALNMLRFSVSKKIKEFIGLGSQVESYIQPYLESLDVQAEEEKELREEEQSAGDEETGVKLVNRIIIDAYRDGASDIHIEPNGGEKPTIVRFRVDGACKIYRELEPSMRHQLSSRVKILANLDIAERRKPQDGKIEFRFGKKKIELRVATIPTAGSNEDVVMRILAGGGPIPLEKLGLSPRNLGEIQRIIKQPYGLILAVGPTGSGKTTTLHSLLSAINQVDRKIWTAEDPIEITQDGLRQVQVNAKIGVTFANVMRSFLRADPDVIMVGEMRDRETAAIGIEASLTGHLVFSTLHTNSAPETITRLLDMGMDPFSFSDALLGVLAQRLARRVCSSCGEERPATPEELLTLETHLGEARMAELRAAGPLNLRKGSGCKRCGNTGNSGRMGIHELLVNNEEIARMILEKGNAAEIRELAVKGGMTTLLQDGLEKCLAGVSDIRQVTAVCGT